MKRTAVAFLASLALHATLLAAALHRSALALWPSSYAIPITLEEIRDLPLRRPPGPQKARAQGHEAPKARRATEPNPGRVLAVAAKARDADRTAAEKPAPTPAAGNVTETRRRGDVSAYGPDGSRVVAVLRLDRLRAAPDARADIAAVDDLLRLLPDRKRLLEKTDLDLYRDFDVLLVATPNPFDDSATFVAARHRLGEKALRAALDRGARAGGQPIKWHKERGRYVGVRTGPGAAGAPQSDERLILLPAPGLVVIASPAYAKLVLGGTVSRGGGATAPGSASGAHEERSWSDLVARVDAEDGAVPADAAFVLTATHLVLPSAAAAAGASGVDENASPTPSGPAPPGQIATPPGPPMPSDISILIGTSPGPFVEIRAEFGDEAEAQACESQWPSWKRDLLANPLLLLARVDPLVSRTELRRDGRTVVLRTIVTDEELLRLLRMTASLVASADAGRAPGPEVRKF